MGQDYKQQLWLMTNGLGEWMDRRERRRRRRRWVALGVGALVIVTLAVLGVVLLIFPRNVYHQHNTINNNNYFRSEMLDNATQEGIYTVDTTNGQLTTINNYYSPEMLGEMEELLRRKAQATAETGDVGNTGIEVKGDEGETVRIGKNGIKVKDSDGEEVNISLDLDDLIKRYGKQ